jgi:hypothetical protein
LQAFHPRPVTICKLFTGRRPTAVSNDFEILSLAACPKLDTELLTWKRTEAIFSLVLRLTFFPKLGLLGTWALAHLGSWALGLWGTWALGHLGTWALGLLGTWALGLVGTWAHGLLGTWALGHLGTWVLRLTFFSKAYGHLGS